MPRTLNDLAWPVRTDRLTIRRASVADADATWAYRRLASVGRWLASAAADRDEYAQTFTEPRRLADTLIVEPAGAGRPIVLGDLKFRVENAWAQTEVSGQAAGVQAEVGWAFDPAHGHHGYATESAEALLRIAFHGLGLRRVVAYCFATNEPSWRLMERIGMRRESYSVADALCRDGTWADGMVYAMLADEWRARPVGESA